MWKEVQRKDRDKGKQGMWKQSKTLTQSGKNGGYRKYCRSLYLMGYF